MPATEAFVQAPPTSPERHGIYMPPRGTFVAAGRERDVARMPSPDIRFAIGLWPSELAAYLDVDDAFRDAALRLRQLGPKLVASLQLMQPLLEDLKNRAVGAVEEELTVDLVERTPLTIDSVAQYLAQILDHTATIAQSCYGESGASCSAGRGSLRRLAQMPLMELDPALAQIIAPGGVLPDWAETLASSVIGGDPDFAALPLSNDPNLYLMTNHPNFERADADQRMAALKASAQQTIAAAEAIDAAFLPMCRWLDELLDYLIGVVCERAADGDQLRQRWSGDGWTIIQRLSFSDPDAALAVTRAFPAISEGPLLPGTELE